MTDADLDRSYTALCHALSEVGQPRAELLLAMVCLGLMARCESAQDVQPLIERARARCLQDGPHAG